MLPTDLRPRPRADPALNDMYLGLHKSVSAARGTHTGLSKSDQLSQVKRIQCKTKYTHKNAPNSIPRQQIKTFATEKFTYPKIRLLSKF